ncbi:M24 family metallopeptidase [Cognaticolwellia beringensis]|uniref:Aminopeptidase P family protein n=1 Tax=Cognaticolwellia beringensis TaxID=1967665 RepID=A0A222GCW0_9GAMM|nr:Xaa-Pro peptidase family protein [Cognaticolwellia beringensis]ASP49698.1 aminopeptidase P family protein [Cognaticolwellia beringensis]
MTIGVGGSTAKIELEKLVDMTGQVQAITEAELKQRIAKAQTIMAENNIAATYIDAGTNLYYFTGTRWYASERMVGAIIPQQGEIKYITPFFEVNTLSQYMTIKGEIKGWQEHESPYHLVQQTLAEVGITSGRLAIDESAAFFIADGIKKAAPDLELVDAKCVTAGCRAEKSDAEIALLQQAKDMTIEVHKAVARILHVGITTQEVTSFIDQAHRKVGAPAGSYFCIVLFGEDSSYPHGVKSPKTLENNDIVLIDTGCQVEGYNSDITRTYVFGEPNQRQRDMWQIEKLAQKAAFDAAKIGVACGDVDVAARDYLASQDLGPDYQTPGCPHRTGHGVGLDIHEWPYLVRSDRTPLTKGMCFSNEPMLVIPNEFGIRLEDHFYMTDTGAKWFTEPSYSIDDPFGYQQA